MQASTNVSGTQPERRAGRRGRVVLALLAALVVSLFALLESERPTQAIIGGSKATANPDMAALFYQPRDPKLPASFFCSGTLIDSDSVLTAAHCFHGLIKAGFNDQDVKRGAIKVTVGAVKLGAGQGIVRDAETIWIHGGYDLTQDPDNPTDQRYDAAVLTLNQPVTGANIRPADLATAADNRYEQKGQVAYVAGWGSTTSCTGDTCQYKKQLRWVEVTIKDDQTAEKQLNSGLLRKRGFKFYPDLMVAAGGPHGAGPCKGDSGGPLWVEDNGRYPVIGIYSAGRCGGNVYYYPDMYTEVNNPSVRTFIVNHMR